MHVCADSPTHMTPWLQESWLVPSGQPGARTVKLDKQKSDTMTGLDQQSRQRRGAEDLWKHSAHGRHAGSYSARWSIRRARVSAYTAMQRLKENIQKQRGVCCS